MNWSDLNPIEQKVLRLLADGKSNKEIAREVGRSVSHINHMLSYEEAGNRSIYRKIGVENQKEAVTWYWHNPQSIGNELEDKKVLPDQEEKILPPSQPLASPIQPLAQDDVQSPVVQWTGVWRQIPQITGEKLSTLTILFILTGLVLLSASIFVYNREVSFSASSEQTTIEKATSSTTSIITSTVPTFTCWVFNFASYYPLLQMKQEQIDLQNGFNLELFPWHLATSDNRYMTDNTDSYKKLLTGEWQCMMDTLESPARHGNYGVITTIIDESVGADQVWARKEIKTINDIKGKRISFIPDSSSEFIFYTILNLIGLKTSDVVVVPVDDFRIAVKKFKQEETDVVIGTEPDTLGLEMYEGHKILDSSELRYAVDVITISHQAIDATPELVQAFHRAWFQTLKRQFDNLPASAQSIAAWGHNDWTGIHQNSAETDLSTLLKNIAQAGYGPNLLIMQNPQILYDRLKHTRSIWSLSNTPLPSFSPETAVDPRFILGLREDASIISERQPLNGSFIMSGQPPYPTFQDGKTLAVLSCNRFDFSSEDLTLSKESQKKLDKCVVPILKTSRLYLKITGSSAWPGPPGTYSEATITDFARNRTLTIAQYLANHGIAPERLLLDFTLPPMNRREIQVESELEKDRFVKLELVTGQK